MTDYLASTLVVMADEIERLRLELADLLAANERQNSALTTALDALRSGGRHLAETTLDDAITREDGEG